MFTLPWMTRGIKMTLCLRKLSPFSARQDKVWIYEEKLMYTSAHTEKLIVMNTWRLFTVHVHTQ